MFLGNIKLLTFYWTTRDPYDPVADFRSWLEYTVGPQGIDWDWIVWDVVSGETDEETIVALKLPPEAEFMFLLSNSHHLKLYDHTSSRNIEW